MNFIEELLTKRIKNDCDISAEYNEDFSHHHTKSSAEISQFSFAFTRVIMYLIYAY